MADGGHHFDSKDVDEWCTQKGVAHIMTAAYTPWVNSLVEDANKLLLCMLQRMCAPDLDELPDHKIKPEDIPRNWPDHFQVALNALNNRIIPSLGFWPRELMLGMALEPPMVGEVAAEPVTERVTIQMAFVDRMRADGVAAAELHAIKQKAVFDTRVRGQLTKKEAADLDKGIVPTVINFQQGDLVQV